MIDSMNKPIKINANTLPFIYYKMVAVVGWMFYVVFMMRMQPTPSEIGSLHW